MDALIPVEEIGPRMPRPDPGRRRVKRELQPMLAIARHRFGPRALGGFPRAFCDVADEGDLGGRPDARCCVVRAKSRHHPATFDQRHADKRRNLSAFHRDPL